jgi:glycosyltransferase involved in cell wall biosynthesis
MITLVSHKAGQRKGDARVFQAILVSSTVLCAFGVFLLGVAGKYVVPVLFGDKSLVIVPYLLEYSLAIAFFTLGNALVLYHLAKRHYAFVYVSLAASLAIMFGIYLAHESVAQIVRVVFVVSHANLLVLGLLHAFRKKAPFFQRGLRDLSDLFSSKPLDSGVSQPGGRRILIFNWRDSRHAYAGGAEVYVEEMAKRWVKNGDSVMLFCGNDGKSPRHEVRDGIDVTRRGGFYLVYFWAFAYYMVRFRGRFDVIIDCHNGIPFFTPLYVREPVYCLLHHVHQNVFYRYLPKPLAAIACFLEKDLMPLVYRDVSFITVSESSRNEMSELGIGKKGISIVHPGVDLSYFVPGEKSENPTVLYLGRLKAYKSVDILIRAFRRVLRTNPDATLTIAGDGDEKVRLKKLAYENLGMEESSVRFLGFVPESKKRELLQSSWMLVQPSSMEGWGIVAIEASACHTPVVASDVPGLRDSVKNPHSGFLVRYGDEKAFAERITQLILDEDLRREMGFGGREWSARFDWDVASKRLYDIIAQKEPV